MSRRKPSPGQTSLFDARYCLFCGATLSGRQRKYCSRLCQRYVKRIRDDAVAWVRQLRLQGMSYKRISVVTGVSIGSVYNYAKSLPGKHNSKEVYKFRSPQGRLKIVPPKAIGQFCKTHKLTYVCLRDVWKGKQYHHKGWTRA